MFIHGHTRREGGRKYGSPYRRPIPLPSRYKMQLTHMAHYHKKRTPAQIEADRVRQKIARLKRIEQLKAYSENWNNPAMEARAAMGRQSIAERKAVVVQSLQRFLQRQDETNTRLRWIQVIQGGEQQIITLVRQTCRGQSTKVRAKSAEHLFRTMVREGMFRLNLETGLWENRCKAL
jgi:hypothetical protein